MTDECSLLLKQTIFECHVCGTELKWSYIGDSCGARCCTWSFWWRHGDVAEATNKCFNGHVHDFGRIAARGTKLPEGLDRPPTGRKTRLRCPRETA